MEDLNNHQMILLATLVSFVTSIATGIITVSLLQQAPQTVTQTVNRVVERTIERVVTGTSTSSEEPKTITQEITKEVTVFAKEDDLLVSAVEKNQPRIAQIYPQVMATGTPPVARGFVVSRDGLIVTTMSDLGDVLAKKYSIKIGDRVHSAELVEVKNVARAIAFLRITDLGNTTLDAVAFGGKVDPKIGQTVVALGGEDGSGIFKTILSRLVYEEAVGTTTPRLLSGIEVTPKIPEGYNGALIANLDGQTVGMAVWSTEAAKYIVLPAVRILDAVTAYTSQQSQAATTKQQSQESESEVPKQVSVAVPGV